jgi:hypothetical protein
MYGDHGDGRELNQKILVAQSGDEDGCTDGAGVVRKELTSNPLDRCQMVAVHQICRNRDQVIQDTTNGGEDDLDIAKTLAGLFLDVTKANDPFVGVPGDLTCEVYDMTVRLNHTHAEATTSGVPYPFRVKSSYHRHFQSSFKDLPPPERAIYQNTYPRESKPC